MREELTTVQRDLEASRVIRSELALELANATSDRKLAEERLETERLRAEELIQQIEEKEKEINNYRMDLLNKDQEIREKEKTILELENLIVSAAKNDESVSKVEELTTPLGGLKPLIERWKQSSKPTRDWTKANQLLDELEKLIN